MEYNLVEIGERFKAERKAAGFHSQDDLCDFIKYNCYRSVKRETVSTWEHGKQLPPLEDMLILCNKFNCDLGYLLCEYNYRTRPDADIAAETGLSQKAIDSIKNLSEEQLKALDVLLQSVNFQNALDSLQKFIEASAFCNALEREGVHIPMDRSDNAVYYEYETDTNFRFAMSEIGSTEEKRRKLFKAMVPK